MDPPWGLLRIDSERCRILCPCRGWTTALPGAHAMASVRRTNAFLRGLLGLDGVSRARF